MSDNEASKGGRVSNSCLSWLATMPPIAPDCLEHRRRAKQFMPFAQIGKEHPDASYAGLNHYEIGNTGLASSLHQHQGVVGVKTRIGEFQRTLDSAHPGFAG